MTAFLAVSIPISGPLHSYETDRFQAYIVDMSFGNLLDILGNEMDLQFSGDRSKRIRISDLQLNGPHDQVVDTIMRQARMDHFMFNGQIYFAPIDSRAVRLIPLTDNITAAQAREALAAAGLNIPGYDITEVSNGRALVLSGPVRYLALSEGVLSALPVVPDIAEAPVRVRRGGMLVAEDAVVSPVSNSTN